MTDLGDVHTILDVGCGTGKIHPFLAENGYYVEGVDTCDTCLSSDVDFQQADIMELSGEFVHRYPDAVLCSDVMEHLPEEIISEALRNLRVTGRIGAVIGISLLPDSGKLHCSVHDAAWWGAKLKENWPIVERREVPELHPRQGPDSWGLWLCRKEAKA